MPRDIRIQPNRGTTGSTQQPTIYFSGTTGATINLKVEDDGSIVFEGNNGGLFNITDSKDGLLTSVNDVSGLPIFSVYSTDKIIAGAYNQNAFVVDSDKVFIGSDTRTVPSGTKLAVSGNTLINGTLTATTISATTYQNLPLDVFVTGGTYSASASTIIFRNNTGGTFNVTGITVSSSFTGGTVTGATIFNNGLSANTISATTYFNLPTDVRVTGGTYSASVGTAIFTNNTGGTFNVSGFSTTTQFTGGTVSGATIFTNGLSANTISATTITATTFYGSGSGLTNIPIAGVTNLQSSLDNKFDKTGGTVTGNVIVTGDVTILGTATTINTQTLTVKDNVITLNSNYSAGTPFFGTSGIEVLRGSATTASLLWDESTNKWVAGLTGDTKQILLSGDSLSLLNSGHTHPISEITNLQSSLDNKFDKSGGIVSGATNFTSGLSANTISATTYQNLPLDINVTGGTYSAEVSTIIFTNNTGGTFNVTGITATGGGTFTGGTVTGATIFTNGLSANTISATTYYNLPLDITITGGTYSASSSTIIFTNNTGGTFNVTGITSSSGAISGSCHLDTTTTTGLEFKKIATISGFTNGSFIVKSYITAYSGSSNYGFWERTLGIVTTGGTPTITKTTEDFDKYIIGFVPSQVVYTANTNNYIDIYISGVTGNNYSWTSVYEIKGVDCNGGGTTVITATTSNNSIQINDIYSYQFLLMGA